jgi:hypothetical protein
MTGAELQALINNAVATSTPLVVEGTLTFPASNGANITLKNVYLNSTAWPVIDIDTQYCSNIDWQNGVVKYVGAAAPYPSCVVRIKPRTAIPDAGTDEPYPITKFSTIVLPKIQADAPLYTVVWFDEDTGATVNNRIKFMHVDAHGNADNGITVKNPPNGDNAFVQNEIDFGLVDAFKATGIQEGSGPRWPSCPLGTNIWLGAITYSVDGCYAGYQTFGVMNTVILSSISQNAGSLQYGVFFSSGSLKNYVISRQTEGTIPVADIGSGNVAIT